MHQLRMHAGFRAQTSRGDGGVTLLTHQLFCSIEQPIAGFGTIRARAARRVRVHAPAQMRHNEKPRRISSVATQEEQNMAGLRGKRVLVTGASGIVALPVAAELAKNNDVYAVARYSDPKQKQMIEAAGARAITF